MFLIFHVIWFTYADELKKILRNFLEEIIL